MATDAQLVSAAFALRCEARELRRMAMRFARAFPSCLLEADDLVQIGQLSILRL